MKQKTQNIYAEILRDLGTWFGETIRMAFYVTEVSSRQSHSIFSVVAALSVDFEENNKEIPQQIVESESYLAECTKKLLEGNTAPDSDVFQSFWQSYEGLAGLIQRLEKDAMLSDSGTDPLTGLRSAAIMIPDLERELERRARRGQPFSIALTRIDGASNNKDAKKISLAVKVLQKTLRSFDDAYVTLQGDFLVSLKHSDVNGALKFANRLADALERHEDVDFTMSCCVAEPMPGDNIQELIDNTRVDLNHLADMGEGTAGQYEDLSPLSRFIQTLGETDKS